MQGAKPGNPPVADGSSCSDGQICTTPDVCSGGTCTPGAWQCECTKNSDCKDDGDLCNGKPACDTSSGVGVCKVPAGSAVVCDTSLDGPCVATLCDPDTGTCSQTPKKLDTPCDDGQNRTDGDTCDGLGVCVPGTDVCSCQVDADCKQDGDLCNGSKYCDKSDSPPICKVNPATVVVCDTSKDTPCRSTSCIPTTGLCVSIDADDGALCDDGVNCTANDACKGGQCTPGSYVCGCQHDADCVAKDDGNLCNGTLYCDKASGSCKPNASTVVQCPAVDDTACAQNLCQPKTGSCVVTELNAGKACDDGSPCTVGEVCEKGVCGPGAEVGCPCKSDLDCADKEDGNLCNGTLFCNKAAGKCEVDPTSVVSCPTAGDTACAKNVCNPKTGACGLAAVKAGAPCSDASACTVGDVCGKGACVPGPNACPCQTDGDCAGKDDGDLCNGTLFCDKANASCVLNPATVVSCPSANDTACSKNRCAPATGLCAMTAEPNAKACDDGSPCSTEAVCVDGECKAKGLLGCDDGQVCTDDSCDPKIGCVHVANTAPCPDNEVCTIDEVCVELVCTTKQNPCDDGNTCTTDSCKNGVGCEHAAVGDGTGCDDGDACTSTDLCAAGACKPGKAKECVDDRVCTVDSCDPKTGKCVWATLNKNDQCGPQVFDRCFGTTCLNDINERRVVWVPGGKTAVGASSKKYPYNQAWLQPSFIATVSGYYILQAEVDIGWYKLCQASGACSAPSCSWAAYSDAHPARCISRAQAEAFCACQARCRALRRKLDTPRRSANPSAGAARGVPSLHEFSLNPHVQQDRPDQSEAPPAVNNAAKGYNANVRQNIAGSRRCASPASSANNAIASAAASRHAISSARSFARSSCRAGLSTLCTDGARDRLPFTRPNGSCASTAATPSGRRPC
ncbi:MAG: hypothetical protein H6747_09520 [Deltaproteobacteria bacterium]|nr:hypothetical protein [Deltaproteobacteria bacterium]